MFEIARTPFATLVRHFVKRLFASEQEGGSSMGLGLGAVLAILASPGAFASILLLDKYGTLLQWARGEHIDAIRRSPSDEYFFVVLSMTITGLVTVARWNRLFPDSRDFSNLAILPIPIRNIFLANFAALFGLAVLFALDVNMVSAVLFPLFVTLGTGKESMTILFHLGISHFTTVLSSSLFSFFAVFGLVGVLMLVIPRRIFRPVSLAMRMILVVALLMEFFSNLFFQLFAGRLPGQTGGYLKWVPSFWFLGVYENMLGIAKPVVSVLGEQALLVLGLTIVVSIAAYALCYRRYFLRISESSDKLSGGHRRFRLRLPEAWMSRLTPFAL